MQYQTEVVKVGILFPNIPTAENISFFTIMSVACCRVPVATLIKKITFYSWSARFLKITNRF